MMAAAIAPPLLLDSDAGGDAGGPPAIHAEMSGWVHARVGDLPVGFKRLIPLHVSVHRDEHIGRAVIHRWEVL